MNELTTIKIHLMKEQRCTGCGKCNSVQSVNAVLPSVYQHIAREAVVEMVQEICGSRHVFTDPEYLCGYGRDNTLDLQYSFDILVKPGSTEEIAAVLKICNQYKVPILPRGGGTGVTGGALPCRGGMVLSLERLNKIVSINCEDAYVIVESGVITDDLCRAVEQHGLYFPVAPSSAASSFVGGNVAENAGSVRSCKYGTTADYVLNMEVVLPTGAVIWTGANVPKNSTGLNLTQLFVGSEGVLGIITKVVYRLVQKPLRELVLLTAFSELENACAAVSAIKRSGIQPSAVELICKNAIALTAAAVPEQLPFVEDHIEAQLLIELHETSNGRLNEVLDSLVVLLEAYTGEPVLVGEASSEKERLRKLRYSIGGAMTANLRKYRDLDMSIPPSLLYNYICQVERICREHQIQLVCFGHALDGNLHTMLLLPKTVSASDSIQLDKAVEAIYRFGIAHGGVISGEHGIGLLQKEFMKLQFSDTHNTLMKGIKSVFDPNGILNPGKIFY
jgi:glycolate oxidase